MSGGSPQRVDAIVIGAGFSGLCRRRCDEIAAGGYTGFKPG